MRLYFSPIPPHVPGGKGDNGMAYWRTRTFGDIRVHRVEYTPGHLAAPWYSEGHILPCQEDEPTTKVADGAEPQRPRTAVDAVD